ncbi:MAG: pseudouridine synthase [Arenimonas sp.]
MPDRADAVPRPIHPPSRRPGSGGGRKPSGNSLPHYGIARVLSKRGIASRSVAATWVLGGRVSVDGRVVTDPEFPIRLDQAGVRLDGLPLAAAPPTYLMLNKPRGLVTSAADEQDRGTVYRCLDAYLPWVGPVGRLDKASEGMLLMSNDPAWAARITDPATGPAKTYHVQVAGRPEAPLLARLQAGIDVDGQRLAAASVCELRSGGRNAWLEIVLDEGRNRQIRRLLAAVDLPVLRLVRVGIGRLALGELPKGQWRPLTDAEVDALAPRG